MNYATTVAAIIAFILFFAGFHTANKAIILEQYYKTIHVKSVRSARNMMALGFLILLLVSFYLFSLGDLS